MKAILKFRAVLSSICFIAIGVFFVVISIIGAKTTNSYEGHTTATIVNIVESQEWTDYGETETLETVYTQYISYDVDGVKYENIEAGSCDSSAKIGDTVEISYDTNDPSRFAAGDNNVLLVVGIAGGFSILLGVFLTIKYIFRRR